MRILDIFIASFIPVLKVLLLTVLGLFLALERVDILGAKARKHLNNVAFFVFTPSLIASSLANSVTVKSIGILRFMPLNILFSHHWLSTWMDTSNLGTMPLIIIPAVCKEKGGPFGNADVCYNQGIAYASLSMAISSIYMWLYVYNIVRIFSSKNSESEVVVIKAADNIDSSTIGPENVPRPLNIGCSPKDIPEGNPNPKMPFLTRIKLCFQTFASNLNLRKVFAPSTIGAIIGFMVGVIPQLRKVIIGDSAPLRVVQDTTSLLGEASIPTVGLIVGANLLRGLERSRIHLSIIVGIIVIRYIILPILGVCIVKGAIQFGLVNPDHKLYQFILLLQFAVPPAISIGTMTQLHGAGQSECSVIMLWTYTLASVSLTLWSIFFMWFVG
ncbi:hypothetical protein Dsin_014367 [Dipteronia sinensis]|uniref:PIN-like protein n=1 Tax=Dipteronia sinensis TaxID=43782 RepID=A0AAE0AM32_9ROSI|nr:hypothetical protein Dsin_014367 [Dipteronia sinensis]